MKIISSDLFRYDANISKITYLKRFFFTPAFRYLFFMRLCTSVKKIKLIYYPIKMILRFYSKKFGFQISENVKIGYGFYIGHFGTIIINDLATIGNNCNIAPGVVIGQTNRGSKVGVPSIGNKVWMGVNSVIVGGITIGNNVLIAPLSYVNFDVPDNSIVMGNPAKIFANIEATKMYIQNEVIL